ncbi:MAG: DUF5615 family PIN-like protein [bacterium]
MPDLKFLANMNISPLTVEELKQKGWDIIRVSEVMDIKTKDIFILQFARKHNRVLITQDLDFSALLALGGYAKPSVINLRVENGSPNSITKRIVEVVSEMENELKKGVIVSVDDVAIRYRSLPIKLE